MSIQKVNIELLGGDCNAEMGIQRKGTDPPLKLINMMTSKHFRRCVSILYCLLMDGNEEQWLVHTLFLFVG